MSNVWLDWPDLCRYISVSYPQYAPWTYKLHSIQKYWSFLIFSAGNGAGGEALLHWYAAQCWSSLQRPDGPLHQVSLVGPGCGFASAVWSRVLQKRNLTIVMLPLLFNTTLIDFHGYQVGGYDRARRCRHWTISWRLRCGCTCARERVGLPSAIRRGCKLLRQLYCAGWTNISVSYEFYHIVCLIGRMLRLERLQFIGIGVLFLISWITDDSDRLAT